MGVANLVEGATQLFLDGAALRACISLLLNRPLGLREK
jgi:hypothetical protein